MRSNVSARESSYAAGEASSETETQMENEAEWNKCGSAGSCKRRRPETEDKGDSEPIFFPPEVVVEILCRLPIRPRAKLQLVCKEWRGFIRGRYLMEKNVDRREVNCCWRNLVAPDGEESFILLDGCDGLLLIKISHTMKLAIWNPATRCILRLPDPGKDAFEVTLSYVKSSGKYLVVSMHMDESGIESCEVLTPGQSESWRPLAFPYVAEAEGRIDKVVVEVVSTAEAIHTVLILQVGSTVVRKLVSLDLETECFTVTCLAKTKFQDLSTLWPVNWNGKLALTNLVGNNLHVTELEDYKKQRWCQKHKVIPLSILREENEDFTTLVPLLAKDGVIWFICNQVLIYIYMIETGRCTTLPLSPSRLPPAGKPYPYKPTLVGLHGMQQDPEFGKRLSSSLKLD